MTCAQITKPPVQMLPCPEWCTDHEGVKHASEWIQFQYGDSPQIWVQMVRHDDDVDEETGIPIMGTIDFTFQVTANPGCWAVDGWRADGYLSCNQLRTLAADFVALADRIDPTHRDGVPL